jgi:hypothetical protein
MGKFLGDCGILTNPDHFFGGGVWGSGSLGKNEFFLLEIGPEERRMWLKLRICCLFI